MCNSPCSPAPITSNDDGGRAPASSLAPPPLVVGLRRSARPPVVPALLLCATTDRVATALPAAVRRAVKYVAFITDVAAPVAASNVMIVAGTVGRPLLALFGRTDTTFRPRLSLVLFVVAGAAGLSPPPPSALQLPSFAFAGSSLPMPLPCTYAGLNSVTPCSASNGIPTVSYTHLTLPTIYSV